jgi:hypothetical protein
MSGIGKRYISIFCVAGLFSNAFAWKKEAHFLTLLPIEGCGIYSSIRVVQDSKSSMTKASAITSLSLLGATSALGCAAIFGPQPNYPKLRRIHRYAAFALTAAALWMSIAAGNDSHVENKVRNIAHGYTIGTTVPLIFLSF